MPFRHSHDNDDELLPIETRATESGKPTVGVHPRVQMADKPAAASKPVVARRDVDFLKSALDVEEGIDYEIEEIDSGDSDDDAAPIISPFNPTEIKMEQRVSAIYLLIQRIANHEINLNPDFQRMEGIWSDRAQSQLIESLLIRIPLPAFYMDATNDDKWLVIDGLQRLTALKRFVIDKSLKLKGLEFLHEYEGKTFDEIPRSLQRRIEESQVTLYLVKEGTPPKVKFNIFKRINTGGVPLSGQEIRHALNLGKSTDLLKELAASPEFRQATANSIKPTRMADREMVLRFLAFTHRDYTEYGRSDELDGFLTETMDAINKMTSDQIDVLRQRFKKGMQAAYHIFEDRAFRKQTRGSNRRSTVSKALFEAWAVNLARCSEAEIQLLTEKRDLVLGMFIDLMDDPEFVVSISYSTGDSRRVHYRFGRIEELIQEIIDDHTNSAG